MKDALQQSTATYIMVGPIRDVNGTLITTATLASTKFWLSKNGAAFVNPHDTTGATKDASLNGYYRLSVDATDVDSLGRLLVAVDPGVGYAGNRTYVVITAAVYASLISGTGKLPATVASGDLTLSATNKQSMRDAMNLAATGNAGPAKGGLPMCDLALGSTLQGYDGAGIAVPVYSLDWNDVSNPPTLSGGSPQVFIDSPEVFLPSSGTATQQITISFRDANGLPVDPYSATAELYDIATELDDSIANLVTAEIAGRWTQALKNSTGEYYMLAQWASGDTPQQFILRVVFQWEEGGTQVKHDVSVMLRATPAAAADLPTIDQLGPVRAVRAVTDAGFQISSDAALLTVSQLVLALPDSEAIATAVDASQTGQTVATNLDGKVSEAGGGASVSEIVAGVEASTVLAKADNKIKTNASGQVETSNPASPSITSTQIIVEEGQ